MPFQSEKQRRFMWKFHPDIAKKWAKEEKSGNYSKNQVKTAMALRKKHG